MSSLPTAVSSLSLKDIRSASDAQLREWLSVAADAELNGAHCSMIRIELRARERDRAQHKGAAGE